MAAAFVATACAVTAAPLNPAYREDEFHFYMEDLHARALLVEEGSASPAIAAARRLGIPVLTLQPQRAAGAFTITGEAVAPPSVQGYAEGGDVALVLHTSGTTSRPKIVPLTQANLLASASNIRNTLQLTARDRCLNIMPLFHIHGLMAAVLATLTAGGSVFATPGFNALKFFGWMEEAQPTWYTAVPTMHQAILQRAERNAEIDQGQPAALHPLEFRLAAGAGVPRAGTGLRLPRHRSLCDDRERPPDDVEPAAAGQAQAGLRRLCRRPRGRRHVARRQAARRPARRARW